MVLWWQTWEFIKLSWSTGRPPLRRHSSELKLVYYQSFEYAFCENRCLKPKIENKKKNVHAVKVIRMKHNMKQQKGIFVESLWLLMNKVTLLRKPFIMNHFSSRVVQTNIGRDVLKIKFHNNKGRCESKRLGYQDIPGNSTLRLFPTCNLNRIQNLAKTSSKEWYKTHNVSFTNWLSPTHLLHELCVVSFFFFFISFFFYK